MCIQFSLKTSASSTRVIVCWLCQGVNSDYTRNTKITEASARVPGVLNLLAHTAYDRPRKIRTCVLLKSFFIAKSRNTHPIAIKFLLFECP